MFGISTTTLKRGVTAVAITTGILAGGVAQASAADPVRPLGRAIAERGGPGNTDVLFVHGTNGPDAIDIGYGFSDDYGYVLTVVDQAGVMAGTNCRSIRSNTGYSEDGVVACFYPATIRKVKVFTYDGDDRVRIGARAREQWPVEVWGGADDDALQAFSGGRPAVLLGGDGDDTLIGSSRREGLFGGPGNDLIRPGGGADHIDGGHGAFNPEPFARSSTNNPGECAARTHGFWDRYADDSNVEGTDTLDLANLSGGALADLNVCRLGYFGSGSVGLVHAMENVIGTRFNDRLTGDEDNNVLRPGSGEDWVSGEAGDDAIDTVDRSADTVRCSAGNDSIRRDRLDRPLACAGNRFP